MLCLECKIEDGGVGGGMGRGHHKLTKALTRHCPSQFSYIIHTTTYEVGIVAPVMEVSKLRL